MCFTRRKRREKASICLNSLELCVNEFWPVKLAVTGQNRINEQASTRGQKLNGLTQSGLNDKWKNGYKSVLSGDVKPADKVFASLHREFDL